MQHFFRTLTGRYMPAFAVCLMLLCLLPSGANAQQVLWPQDTPANLSQGAPNPVNMVFQRDNTNKATVRFIVATANNATATSIQIRFRRYDYTGNIVTAYIDPRPGSPNTDGIGNLYGVNYGGINQSCQVSFTLDLTGGMYELQATINGAVATRDFGVGEVFAIAGQSNAAGYAKDANPEAAVNNVKFVHFNNNKTAYDGDDPESVNRKYYRYYWGKLGSQLAQTLNVPVAFYQAGWSGTSVTNWLASSQGQQAYGPYGGAYTFGYPYQNLKTILQTIRYQVGLRGVLWHQGERYDSGTNYNDELDGLIQQSRTDVGNVPLSWVIARASYRYGSDYQPVIQSQNRVLTAPGGAFIDPKAFGNNATTVYNRANIFSGPETDTYTAQNGYRTSPDNTHFNLNGQNAVADAWYTALTQTYGGQNFFSYNTALLNTQSTAVNAPACTNCTPPGLPYPTASPASVNAYQQATLSASGCSGTLRWSNSQTGASVGAGNNINVYPAATTTYLVYCETTAGCRSGNSSITVSVPANPGGGGNTNACSAENVAGVGNSSETVTYNVSVGSAGSYTIKVNYSEWENQSGANASIKINGGGTQGFSVSSTGGPDNYIDYSFTATLNAGNNSFQLFGGNSGYIRFKKVCVEGSGSGCNPPAQPSLSASPGTINSGQSANLTAGNCAGTVTWSTGQTGSSIWVSPSATTTYLANCSSGGCSSSNSTITITVNGTTGGSGGCSAENIAGAGNGSENVTYTLSVGSGGTYTIRINCSEWETSSVTNARLKVNGGADQYFNVSNTGGPDNYVDITLTATLNAGSNSFQLFGGTGGYIRFKKVCVQSGARLAAEPAIDRVEPLTVAPNPSQGFFQVSTFVEAQQPASLAITDLQGKNWFSKGFVGQGHQLHSVQLATQAKGMLIVSLTANGKVVTRKILVQP